MAVQSDNVEVGIRADVNNFKPRAKDYEKTFTSVTIHIYENGMMHNHELSQTAARHLGRGLLKMADAAKELS